MPKELKKETRKGLRAYRQAIKKMNVMSYWNRPVAKYNGVM